MTDTKNQNRDQWHLDKRVPVGIILSLAAQTLVLVWVLATAFAQINTNSRDLDAVRNTLNRQANAASEQAIQLGRIEEQTLGLRNDMNRLINTLERRGPRRFQDEYEEPTP